MSKLAVTSVLGAPHRDALERVFFFNENQARAQEGVTYVVNRYGAPRIVVTDDERLRIDLDSSVQPQSLFAVVPAEEGVRPVGVVVFTREEERLVVLFVAIDGDYTKRGSKGDYRVLPQLIDALKAIALRVRGITSLLVYLGRPTPTRIKLRRPADEERT